MKRFLIISSEYGSGHRMPAEALYTALRAGGADARILSFSDIIGTQAEDVTRKLHAFATTHFPFLHRGLAAATDSDAVLDAIAKLIPTRIIRGLDRIFASYRPDCVIATYPAANRVIAGYQKKYGFRLVSVVTDLLSVHAYWIAPSTDRYFVPLPETARVLRKLGIPENRISVFGYPLRPPFSALKNKAAARRTLGIPADSFAVLYMLHSAPDPFAAKLAKKITRDPRIALVAVCGRDKKFARGFAKRIPSARTLGFIENVDEYLAASDAAIGKAGPGFLMECAAAECIPIVTKYLKPQEEGNVRIFQKKKLGFLATNADTAMRRIQLLMKESPARRIARAEALRKLAPADATRRIAEFLIHW